MTTDKEHELAPPAPVTQAGRIFSRFGGVRRLHRALVEIGRKKDVSALYRWNHARAIGGTDGLVPSSAMPDVLAAARHEGVVLTPEDLTPQRRS